MTNARLDLAQLSQHVAAGEDLLDVVRELTRAGVDRDPYVVVAMGLSARGWAYIRQAAIEGRAALETEVSEDRLRLRILIGELGDRGAPLLDARLVCLADKPINGIVKFRRRGTVNYRRREVSLLTPLLGE